MADAEELSVFARIELRGGRFDAGLGLPLETLPELTAYRELLVECAKELFRRANRKRQRVPKGFEDGLVLRLRSVDKGSAIPVLERRRVQDTLGLPDEFDRARDLIAQYVNKVTLPGFTPEDWASTHTVIAKFDRFGRSLRVNEQIVLVDSQGAASVYDRDVRKKIVLRESETYQGAFAVDGRVTEIDAAHGTFQIATDTSEVVVVPYDESTFAIVKEHLRPAGDGPILRVEGIGLLNRDDALTRVDQVTALESSWQRAYDRLEEIAALPAGWLDGDGEPASSVLLDDAAALFHALSDADCPQPRVFPTSEGGVQAEWTIGPIDLVVRFGPSGPYALAVNTHTGSSEEMAEPENPRDTEAVEYFIRERLEAGPGDD